MKLFLAINTGYDYYYPEVLGIFTTEQLVLSYLESNDEWSQ
jgi:hypothetical protein